MNPNGAALVNRLGGPMQPSGGSAYNPSSELLAMLANAQSNPGAPLLQNMDPSKLASLDALSMAAASGNPQGISPQVALAHLKQQQALLAAAAGGLSAQGASQGQPQLAPGGEFHGDDEFPSLAGGRGQQGQGGESMYSQPNGLRTSGSIAVPGNAAAQQLQQAAAVLAQQQQQLQQLQQLGAKAGVSVGNPNQQIPTQAPGMPPTGGAQPPAGQAAVAASDPFGLLGLTRVLKMTDKDLNTLALGTDLTTLGLNLSSPEFVPTNPKFSEICLFCSHVSLQCIICDLCVPMG
jgi:hypothetical protein